MNITREKGSVFDAIEPDAARAELLKIKAALTDELIAYIQNRKLTHQEASERMGVSRPRVTDMVNGRISKFTIDALVSMAARVKLFPIRVNRKAA